MAMNKEMPPIEVTTIFYVLYHEYAGYDMEDSYNSEELNEIMVVIRAENISEREILKIAKELN